MSASKIKEQLMLAMFAWVKVPLIGFCSPKFIESSEKRSVVKIPLKWITKNHLGAMYFGAIAIGSELCVAAYTVKKVLEHNRQNKNSQIDFVFKDFNIQFLKRAEGHVHFICDEVNVVSDLVEKASQSEERFEQSLNGYAVVPSKDESVKVATFGLTLSLKRRVKKNS